MGLAHPQSMFHDVGTDSIHIKEHKYVTWNNWFIFTRLTHPLKQYETIVHAHLFILLAYHILEYQTI